MDDPSPRPSREPLLFAAACLVAATAFLGTRGLWETDEGRYAEVARKMLATGEWLVPMRHGAPHLTKPPGAYWLTAAGVGLLGANAWGARLLVGLAFAASAACVRVIGRGLLGPAAGARAGWIYLTLLYPFALGSVLTTDTYLAALVAASCAASVVSLRSPRPALWHLAAGLALGGAVFVKGPPALVPWAGFAIGWALGGRTLVPGRRPFSAAGLAVAAVAGLWWFLWADRTVPGAHEQFFGTELRRFSSPGDHEPQPLWFYPAVLAAGLAPWWLPFVRGVRAAGLSPAGWWLLAWALVTFSAFEAAASKSWAYVLPVAAPMAVWAGAWARDRSSPWPARPWALAVLLTLLCGGRLVAATEGGRFADRKDVLPLATEIRTLDPRGALPVATLTERDLDGLEFYLGGRLRRLQTTALRNEAANASLSQEASAHASTGTPWLLVTEGSRAAHISVRKVLGATAEPAGEVGGWHLFRVGGNSRKGPE